MKIAQTNDNDDDEYDDDDITTVKHVCSILLMDSPQRI